MGGEEEGRSRNPLRRLYAWTVGWAARPGGTWALFFISFAESSFFPVPPDVLLIALGMGAPRRSLRFALVCSAGSILGGVAGYLLGLGFGELVSISPEVKASIETDAFWFILTAAFTPIPYKVCTIGAGWLGVNFFVFLAASAIGRPARFFLVGGAIFLFGPSIKPWLERYLEIATIVLLLLLVGGYLLLTYVLGE
jgi:membrane protein YqaA with SNARE-associated domain